MASIKVTFKKSSASAGDGRIIYQITHKRHTRQIITGHQIRHSEWNHRRQTVVTTPGSPREALIRSISEQIRRDVERLTRIITNLANTGYSFTADDIVDEYRRYASVYSLLNFMQSIILKLRQNGRIRTSETYTATLNSFRKFRNGADIMLDCIDSETMEAYEAWLRQRGLLPNSISFYIRIIRAAYNRAVESGIIENRNPFRHVYTGVDKTVKRALPLSVIRKIKTLELDQTPALSFARDMFILSFMLRGMSFIDMAYLRKADLANGYVTYRRRKTGQQLVVEWTREMQAIIDKYPANSSDYLLPIITRKGTNERSTYRNTSYRINRSLKIIGVKIGLTVPLTLYVARHSWASAARTKGIPLSIISEGMGHDSETTTRIYLASLDTSAVDRANSLILKSL